MPAGHEVLSFLITANGAQAIKTFDSVGKANTRMAQTVTAGNKKSAAAYTALGAKQAAFGLVAGGVLVAAASAAADLDKSVGRVNATFKEGGGDVERWAKSANDVFLSDRQAAAYAADVGEAAQGLGVMADEATRLVPEVIEVAAQMSVLKGLDMDNSIESVSAALRGEYDATQKMIPALSAKAIVERALVDSGEAMEKNLTTRQKALATLNIITEEGTEILNGNQEALDSLSARWARTQADLADTFTALGEGALPAVEALATGLGLVGTALAALPAPVVAAAGGLAGIAAAGSLAVGGLNLIRGSLDKIRPRLVQAAANFLALPKAMGALGAVGIAAGVTAVAAGIYLIGQESAKAEAKAKDLTAAVESFKAAVDAGDEIKSWEQLARAATDAESTFDSIADWTFGQGAAVSINGVKIEIDNLKDLIRGFGTEGDLQALQGVIGVLEGIDLSGLQDAGLFNVSDVDGVTSALALANIELDLLGESGEAGAGGIEAVGAAAGESQGDIDAAAEAAERLDDAFSSFDSITAVTQGMLNQADAAVAIADANTELASARESGDPARIAEAERAVTDAMLDQQSTAIDLLSSIQTVADLGPQALADLRTGLEQGMVSNGGLIPDQVAADAIAQIDAVVAGTEGKEVELGLTLEEIEQGKIDAAADDVQAQLQAKLDAEPPYVPFEANTDRAESEVGAFNQGVESSPPATQDVDADASEADATHVAFIDDVTGDVVIAPLSADTDLARTETEYFKQYARGGVVVPVDADTSQAAAQIAALSGSSITINGNVVPRFSNPGTSAPGPGYVAALDGLAGPGDNLGTVYLEGGSTARSTRGVAAGTYINSQTINLPRGADAREVEKAMRRDAARNGSVR